MPKFFHCGECRETEESFDRMAGRGFRRMYGAPFQRQPSVYFSQSLGPREVILESDQETIDLTESDIEEQDMMEEEQEQLKEQHQCQSSAPAEDHSRSPSQKRCKEQDPESCPKE